MAKILAPGGGLIIIKRSTMIRSSLFQIAIAGLLFTAGCCSQPKSPDDQDAARPATFCNPMDLDYRFQLDAPNRREAADPTLVKFDGEYWLFASKSGGYWHSRDLNHWQLIQPTGLPLEDYAPTVEVIDGRMYFTAFDSHAIYSTDDPLTGHWRKVADLKDLGFGDPDIFVDDDGRVYVYYGCSHGGKIQAVELDLAHDFKLVRGPVDCLPTDFAHHGWEVAGEDNLGVGEGSQRDFAGWTEGAWMTKHQGTYYLEYSAPGTQFKSYADGIYTATNPMGPFTYTAYSPYSAKPTGFIGGAGHGSTMEDYQGNYWHIVTMPIAVRGIFERRLGLFPAGFMADGQIWCNTYLGDYPQFAPDVKKNRLKDNSPGWMLLSYRKVTTASSELADHPVSDAFDENIRTWWSAQTGNAGEWLQVDLGKPCRIEAMQINFADQDVTQLGRMTNDAYRYDVEVSRDGKDWTMLLDQRNNLRDAPHDYTQLDAPVEARYVRLTNGHTPGGGKFSVSGFRIFGNRLGEVPGRVKDVQAQRGTDQRQMAVSWPPARGADFYIVRYGVAPDRLFNSYQVYQATQLHINSLNTGTPYYLTVDAVNDSGITRGGKIVPVR